MTGPGTLDFAGLTFNGGAGATGWFLGNLIGWGDAPSSKATAEARPQAHGSFGTGTNWRGARVVTVEGTYRGATMRDTVQARESIAALQGNGIPSLFTYTDANLGPRTLNGVVIVNGPTAPARLFEPFFKFSFDVLAVDPKKYGTPVITTAGLPAPGTGVTYPVTYPVTYGVTASGGRVTVANPGTAETTPLLEVTGELAGGFSLVELGTGREVRFERVVPAGSTVVVNPRTGRAYIDVPGNDVTGFLTRADWFTVPPGGSTEVQFTAIGGVTGAPMVTARTSPAYW